MAAWGVARVSRRGVARYHTRVREVLSGFLRVVCRAVCMVVSDWRQESTIEAAGLGRGRDTDTSLRIVAHKYIWGTRFGDLLLYTPPATRPRGDTCSRGYAARPPATRRQPVTSSLKQSNPKTLLAWAREAVHELSSTGCLHVGHASDRPSHLSMQLEWKQCMHPSTRHSSLSSNSAMHTAHSKPP